MLASTLDILRCPYCGGRLELVESAFHRRSADAIQDGVMGCQCCVFPIVDGIPVMHLQPPAPAAREQVEQGRPDVARRLMVGLTDEQLAARFDEMAAAPATTYREAVDALGRGFEGGYFLYRFSDPTFVVAQAVVRAVAGAVLGRGDRAIDICGGSGHLTRSLLGMTDAPPLLADLYFAKVWLARRFTAPGCEPVCCDGNAPLPFARGAFRYAMCTDAFMYIWTKRQFVNDVERLVHASGDPGGADAGAIVIGHTHNARTWSPSHGQPLPPEGYAALFETIAPRIFAEGRLFSEVVDEGVLDLSRGDAAETLDRDPALTLVASRHPGVFVRHTAAPIVRASGEFRLNPLYAVEPAGTGLQLRLRFPDADYEQEYGACRRYLPEQLAVDRATIALLPATTAGPALAELVRRRVILDLPAGYY